MMYLVASGFSHMLAVAGLDGRVREEIIGLHYEIDARLDESRVRLEALGEFGRTLSLFWGSSYTGLHTLLRESCNHHQNELWHLRAELDHELEKIDDLSGRKLRAAAARLRTLATITDDLQRSIREVQLFWAEEAQWTLDLLGARLPSVWPPEPTQAPLNHRLG
jgi:hypothetical protein